MYKHFIEAVDAVDNGISQWEGAAPPKYLNNTTLSSRVGNLNPKWSDDSSDVSASVSVVGVWSAWYGGNKNKYSSPKEEGCSITDNARERKS